MKFRGRALVVAGRGFAVRALAVVRRIVGVPDYDAYVAHVRSRHPASVPMPREAFVESCLEAKYSRPGQRCC